MHVIIFGCGRSGSALALSIEARGHQVTMIDRNPESFRRLGRRHQINLILGNGLDLDVMQKAGVEGCDAFFAMTRGDNTNLMSAQIVQRNFHVKRVAVKVADPIRAEAYRKMGLFCINAAALLAGICQTWLLEGEYKPIDQYNNLAEEWEI